MELELPCPHCGGDAGAFDPYASGGEIGCRSCGKTAWLEIDEGEEGPTFTLLPAPPDCRLYPPAD